MPLVTTGVHRAGALSLQERKITTALADEIDTNGLLQSVLDEFA